MKTTAERVAFIYQDRMIRRVAARFKVAATLHDELVSKMDHLFANFSKVEAEEAASWFKDNFRFQTPQTPKGQKKLKEEASGFHWFLRDSGGKLPSMNSAVEAERRWKQEIKPLAGDLVKFFSNDGGKIVPKEIQVGGNTYLNLIGFDAKKLDQYVTSLESVFDEVKGWRRKALGGLKVALAGPKEFRGTAGGVYKSEQDTLYVRATPNVLKRTRGTYAAFDYIIIHELGHRYEHKNHVPFDFDRTEWTTSRYSLKEGEAFAELFAISNFGLKGNWLQERVDQFETLMGG